MRASFRFALAAVVAIFVATGSSALVIDFNGLPEGTIVDSADLPAGYSVSANNKNASHPDENVVFDSACPPGGVGSDCSGDDPDLLTPGAGVGNDTAQEKILIVPEDLVDTSPADGLVDDPDDEASGSTTTFTFPAPAMLTSLRLIDIDSNEEQTKVVLLLTAGGTQELFAQPLGNNSAQTIQVPTPVPLIDGFTVIIEIPFERESEEEELAALPPPELTTHPSLREDGRNPDPSGGKQDPAPPVGSPAYPRAIG